MVRGGFFNGPPEAITQTTDGYIRIGKDPGRCASEDLIKKNRKRAVLIEGATGFDRISPPLGPDERPR